MVYDNSIFGVIKELALKPMIVVEERRRSAMTIKAAA
jgi:hypothetical protein